jgi:hypothetical protein
MGRGRKRHRRKPGPGVALEAPGAPDAPRRVRQNTADIPELVSIAIEDLPAIWPLAMELLAPEMEASDWTPEGLAYVCQSGQGQLWMVCDSDDNAIAALVTTRSEYGRCHVAICCGPNLWDFVEVRHQLFAWAKDQGMKQVQFYGREALQKLMPECKRVGVILRKEL